MVNFHVLVLAHCFPLCILTHACAIEEDTFSFPSSSSREEKPFLVTEENLGVDWGTLCAAFSFALLTASLSGMKSTERPGL